MADERPPSPSRRALIALGLGGLLLTGTLGLRELATRRGTALAFEPLADPKGFRLLRAGATTAVFDPLTDTGAAPDPAAELDLCRALFGARQPGAVPIAVFSDFRCPYCRELIPIVADLARTRDLTVRWHEYPLFGPVSVAAARAALAADLQGAYPPFQTRLMGTDFVPNRRYIAGIADAAGLDRERLLADMESAPVTARLAESRALARRFGLPGTPATVVGRTLAIGSVSRETLEALIDLEAKDISSLACA